MRPTTIFKRLITNRNFLILIIATIGMLPQLVNYGGYYIAGDLTHQMLPFVYEAKRMFASGLPFWSWNTYLGDNFIGSYAYYTVFNPFTWINCLFPYEYLGLGFTIVLYLKFLVCGYVAQRYLKKIGFDEQLSLIGCLLYTFSSWAISNLLFYMFMEPMMLFPFLLIFVERFLRKERHAYTGLAMSTFVVIAVNYYFAVINLMVAALYFLCRLFAMYDDGRERFVMIMKAAGCVILGMVCSSVVLFPVLIQLKGTAEGSVDRDAGDIFMWADRLFWLVYPKAHEGRFFYVILNPGWKSNTASIAVFGLLPTLLLFTKKGYGWVKWLTVLMIIMYVTPINGIFSLFTDCNYTRWAYALTLAIIICTLYYIRDWGLPPFKYAVWYCGVVYGVFFLFNGASIYWHYSKSGAMGSDAIVRLALDAVLVAVNAMALLVLCRKNSPGRRGAIVLTVVLCTAMQFFIYSVPDISAKSTGITETDYFKKGMDFRSDDDFSYRTNFTVINKEGRPTCNFGLISNRPSIKAYHSVQNGKIHKWNHIVGDSFHRQRVFYPSNFVKSFEALMSVKDLVVVSDHPVDTVISGVPSTRDEVFAIYESDHYIPMGFAYDRYVLSEDVEAIADSDKEADIPLILLSALAIDKDDEEELSPYMRKSGLDGNLSLDSLVAVRGAISCDSFIGHSRGFDAHISLDSASVVFFSVLADDGFSAYIDGEPTKIYETNLGFSSVIVPAGSHDVSYRYFPPGFKYGLILTLIGFAIGLIIFLRSERQVN